LHNTNKATRSPTWTGLGLNPALRSQRPANNWLSCSTDLSERNSTGDLDVSGRIALNVILEAYGVRVWSRLKFLRIGCAVGEPLNSTKAIPYTHCTGGSVVPRACLQGYGKCLLLGFDPWTVQPVVSRYSGPPAISILNKNLYYMRYT
jgi:hypothetical protein